MPQLFYEASINIAYYRYLFWIITDINVIPVEKKYETGESQISRTQILRFGLDLFNFQGVTMLSEKNTAMWLFVNTY